MADQHIDILALRCHILSKRWILRTAMGSSIKSNHTISMLQQSFLLPIPGSRGRTVACKEDHWYTTALIDIPQFHTIVCCKEFKFHKDRKSTRLNSSHVAISYA